MPFGPFILQWRAPNPNPPLPTPLPQGIERTYIKTPSGPLELLSAIPSSPNPAYPPLFFAHGGFGCAEVWINYMLYFSSLGYSCYAVSYRGHGGSWYPGLLRMVFTSRTKIGEDLVRGITEVGKREGERRGKEGVQEEVVLIAHSAGGALSQWVLGRGMVRVKALCLFGSVPGFGS